VPAWALFPPHLKSLRVKGEGLRVESSGFRTSSEVGRVPAREWRRAKNSEGMHLYPLAGLVGAIFDSRWSHFHFLGLK
jgi:hypothetical protein